MDEAFVFVRVRPVVLGVVGVVGVVGVAGVVAVPEHALPIVGCGVDVLMSVRSCGCDCTSFKHSSLIDTPLLGFALSVKVTRCCRSRGHEPITPGENVS